MENYYLSLVCIGCMWLVASCNVSTSRKQTDLVPKDSIGQFSDREKPVQEVPRRLLDKLGELYGDNPPGVVGFSLESKNCPDFIGGIYINDRDTLVIQIKGDSATIRQRLEKDLQSKEFIVEPCKTYTQKDLLAINDKLVERWRALENTPVMRNVTGAGVGTHDIEIHLIVNTPEKRKEFREQVMDSPAFRFTGVETPVEKTTVGVNDTLGVAIRPEYTVYSTKSDSVKFILYNRSGKTIHCGEHYFITYEDTGGVWRELPINENFVDIGHWVEDDDYREYTAFLFPKVHPNPPGRYRFFYEVTVGDYREGAQLKMMAEFRLSDDKKELKQVAKTPLPAVILGGLSEQEYYKRKEQILETKIFNITDEMPEFPDGGVEGLYAYMAARVPKDDKKRNATLQFVVEKDGSLSHIEVVNSSENKRFDDEAVRIVKEMPKWKPGKRRGRVVRTKYSLSVCFY